MRIYWFFIWTNLNPLHPRRLCAKFGWNWPSGSGEEDENVKSLRQWQRQQRRTIDKFWSEKLTWVLGSGEIKIRYRIQENFTALNYNRHWVAWFLPCRGTSLMTSSTEILFPHSPIWSALLWRSLITWPGKRKYVLSTVPNQCKIVNMSILW